MPKIKRIIRKIPPPFMATVDDQLWPVNVMLLILGGFITGELLVFGDFGTSIVWQNGWTWLAGVWLGIVATMLATWQMGSVMARRTQLSAVLALILTLSMLTGFYFFRVFSSVLIEDGPRDVVHREEVTLPDYFEVPQDQQQVQLEHERPVDTREPETEELEVARQDVEPEEKIAEPQETPQPVPEITKPIEPAPIQRQETRKTPPRKSETTSKLSRQTQPSQAQPEKVSSPTVAQASEPKPAARLEAQTKAITPRKTTASTQQPSPQETQKTESLAPNVQAAQRPTPSTNEPRPSTARPTLRKAVRQPVQMPKVQQVATQSRQPATEAKQPSRLTPTQSIQRQAAASPTVKQQQPNTQVTAQADLPQTKQARATPAPRQTQLARSDLPSATRSAQVAANPTTTQAVAAQVATSRQAAPAASVQPDNPVVRRQAAAAATGAQASRPTVADVAAATPTVSTATTRPRHSTASDVPSVSPHNDATAETRRTNRIAQAAASPVAVSSPATVQSSQPNPQATQPRVAALSRSRRGMAGAGQQKNLDRGEPAPRSVSTVASASARRSRATSQSPDSSALSTSAQARVAKDRAMAAAPSATLQAESLDVAVAAGVQEPSDVDASSSAAMRNSSAAQVQGAITADSGSTDFDTGPTQIASEFGAGRAAGGGEPDLHHATQTPEAARMAAAGGAELAALDTQAVAPEPTDVPAEGGGRPEATPADSLATSAARVRQTGEAPQLATQGGEPSEGDTQQISGGAPQQAAAQVQRSTAAAEALPGAAAGGGTDEPVREAGVNMVADTKADAPTIESEVGGESQPDGIDAAAASVARQAGQEGLPGAPSSDLTGAAESDIALNVPEMGAPGARAGSRQMADAGGQPSPTAATSAGGAPLKEARAANIPGASRVVLEDSELAGGSPAAEPSNDKIELGAGEGTVQRKQLAGTRSLVQAEPGDGGLGAEPAPQIGNPNRKAQRHSQVAMLNTDARFQQREVGGPIQSGNTRARNTQSAFEGRKRTPGKGGGPGRPPRNLEPAIVSGLEFLRIHQGDDGSWSFNEFGRGREGYENEKASIRADVAATGLSLMCFLGAGYDHFDFGGEYTQQVQAGLDYLITHQQEDGNLYIDQDSTSSESAALYSHAMAAMALCEAYGMTRDPKLKEPAQRSLKYIQATQHPERGGWRYTPGKSSDLSVTGWMFAALKSGQLAGLEVDKKVLDTALKYVDRCQGPGGDASRYVYNPNAPATAAQSHGRRASHPMTAVGMLLRLYQGWDRDNAAMQRGADYLIGRLPDHSPGERDTYYWYYATQVMFHMKGNYWETWERRLHEMLRDTQQKTGALAGSWDPRGAIPDKWGAQGGRIYVTSMNLLSLEVRYRYLPLYVEAEN